jgi:hypothetical protein
VIELQRREDWEGRLNDYLATVRKSGHRWGGGENEVDCALAWAGAIEAMTDVDLMAEFRGRYASEEEAMSLIREAGFDDLASLLDDRLPRVPRPSAQRGDLIMVKGGALALAWGSDALAIGEARAVTGGPLLYPAGIVRVPRKDWRKAWKI